MWYINGRVVSLPLTDMRYINGWVVRYSPSPTGEDFLTFPQKGGMNEENRILYSKEQIFEDVPDPYPRGN